jgi:hypothetical protein
MKFRYLELGEVLQLYRRVREAFVSWLREHIVTEAGDEML